MRNRRAAFLVVLLALAGLGYAGFATLFGFEPAATVTTYGKTPPDDAAPRLDAYVEVITIDPVNNSMKLRVSFRPGGTLKGKRLGTVSRDVVVRAGDGSSEREIDLRADQPVAAEMIDADLDGGSVADYPFDRFTAKLAIGAEAPPDRVTMTVALWDGIAAWRVRSAEQPAAAVAPGAVALGFELRRTTGVRFLASLLYGVMPVLAIAGLVVATLVVLRRRKFEASLASLLATMLFALPAMRYGLPGSPPLGVTADLLIYLWAQLGVALSLFLLIGTWAMGDAKP
jgi:hypothetical protein